MDAGNPPRPPAANPSFNPYAQPPAGAPYNAPFNPYAQPASAGAGPTTYAHQPSSGAVSAGAIAELEGTKPWARLLGILSFIMAIIMLIAAVGIGLGGAMVGQGAAGKAGLLAIAVVYVLMAFLTFYPARRMISYAAKIGNLMQSRSVGDLEDALGEQRLLWRFYGILAIVYLVLVALFVVAGVLVPALSGSR